MVSRDQQRCEVVNGLKENIDKQRIVGMDKMAVSVNSSLVNNVMSVLAATVMVPDNVEQPAWLVGGQSCNQYLSAANGLVALAGHTVGELRAHTPDWFCSVSVPYDYEQGATCPQWLKFLDRVLESDGERIAVLQEWFGYLLTPDTSFHKFMFMEGEGANGKSVVLDVLEALLGHENVSHVPLKAFGQRFQLTMALNKLANIAPEVNEHAKLDEGAIKQFVGGDVMYFDRKGIGGIDVKPTARLMVAANSRLAIADRSHGMRRRVLYVPFNVTIPANEQDRELASKLKGELPGILNWAMEGRRRLHLQRAFSASAAAIKGMEEYRAESNPAENFLIDHSQLSNERVSVERVHQIYMHWAKTNGHTSLNAAQFGKQVRKQYPKLEKRRGTTGAQRRWVYQGLSVDDGVCSYNAPIEEDVAA